MKKSIPIGYEDLKELIDKNMYYVDKTGMLVEMIDNPTKVSLFTRPRRFGKTLNLSMIRRFLKRSWTRRETKPTIVIFLRICTFSDAENVIWFTRDSIR